MITTSSCMLDDAIVNLKCIGNTHLCIADNAKNFFIMDLHTLTKVKEFSFSQANTHPEKQTIAYSPDGKFLAYSESSQSVVRVIDLEQQKLHYSFPTLQNKIETLCFDPTSHYLVAGAITGRVLLWNLFATTQVSRLSSFPEYTPKTMTKPKTNYVSAACFSPSGHLVATTGYGGSIVITNIHTEVSPKRITPAHIRINCMLFANENTLIAGNVEGGIDIIDTLSSRTMRHIQSGHAHISSMCLSACGEFLFVTGHSHYVSLYHWRDYTLIDMDYIRTDSKINRIDISDDNFLVLGLENGEVELYNLYPKDLLQLRMKTGAYAKAHELIQTYPLLKHSILHQQLNDLWEENLQTAITHVEEGHPDNAKKQLLKFAGIPSLQKHFGDFEGLLANYDRFFRGYQMQNYPLAYSLAEYNPLLKRTTPYQQMESIWTQTFNKAQLLIIKDQKDKLYSLLDPFNRVTSKQCFIQVLLYQPRLFIEFLTYIKQHDFNNLCDAVKAYPCLKEMSSYQKMYEWVEELFEKFHNHILSKDFELAQLDYEALTLLPQMKERTDELKALMDFSQLLEVPFRNNNFKACYMLIDEHKGSTDIDLVTELEEKWKEMVKEAERLAQLGQVKGIKAYMGELLYIPSRSQKTGMLLRQGYITQIKLLIVKKQFERALQSMHNYIKLFGYDTELDNLITKLHKDDIMKIELSEADLVRRPRSLWIEKSKGMVPDTII